MFDFPNSPTIGQTYTPASGVTYQWDGQAWVNAGLLATASMIERIYLTGVSTWNKPAGLAYAEVEGTAAGGSGSGAAATAAGTFAGGSGGSAGAWGKKLFAASDLPSSVTITVGAAGAATLGAGQAGANTTFGSLITLPGGPAGIQSANTTGTAVLGSQPVSSGPPTGVDIGAAGGQGFQSILNWTTANNQIGGGGQNPYGAAFPTWTTINAAGQPGSGYGCGGASAANGVSQSARLGGAGLPGFIRVREFYTSVVAGIAPMPGTIVELLITSTQTYTVPAGLRFLEVEALGPGGLGGSSASTGAATIAIGGNAGAGGLGKKVFTKAELGTSVSIVVAGAGSNGTSTFTPSGTAGVASVTAGSNGSTGAAAAAVVTPGAAGGTASGWTVNAVGQSGDVNYGGYFVNNVYKVRGKGGSSPYGSGGNGGFLGSSTYPGDAANGFGAGGSGAGAGFSQSSISGGAGSGGFFLLREFY